MGRDVDAIGNHNLKTGSIVLLAEDLSKRLNCKVKYGYVNNENIDDDFLFKEQGSFGVGNPIYYVHDTYHFERKKNPDKYANTVCYEILLEQNPDDYNTFIFKDAFLAEVYYDNRWWGFCRVFTHEYIYGKLTVDFRNEVYRQVTTFGGDTAIYFDDQANGDNNTFDLEEISFNTFKQNLLNDGSILDISLWFDSGAQPLKEYPLGFIDDFKSLGQPAEEY